MLIIIITLILITKKTMKKLFLLLILATLTFFAGTVKATDEPKKEEGTIRGKIIDREVQTPVRDALIKILDTEYKAGSDEFGEFEFTNLKFGTYRIEVVCLGYASVVKTDIAVSSNKPLFILIELETSAITTSTIEVEASYFQKNSNENISSMNLDYEEVRRAPGAAEDISRVLQSAPGVSVGNDQRNDLIVRGGSPSENLILIDGMDIPNINHFGSQGSTGGPIGLINLKFIREADIYTGGFSSKFGDRLSSVVDIKFREGSRTNYINNLDFSFAGFGGVFEGPLTKKGSYLLSIRRSYLDLLKDAIRLSAVPNYWDINMKLNLELDENNYLSLIGFGAIDKINFETGNDDDVNDMPYDSDNKNDSYTLGLNYKRLFKDGYMQAVVSNSYSTYYSKNIYAPTGIEEYSQDSYENELNIKYDINYRFSPQTYLNIGIGGKHGTYNNKLFAVSDTTPEGYVIPPLDVENKINTNKLYASVNVTHKLFNEKLLFNAGLRYDYLDFINNRSTIAPRLGLTYRLTQKTNLNASFGIFYQTPISLWLASNPANKNLNSIRADHYIVGLEHFFTPEIRTVLEVYEKRYNDYPVSVSDPRYILIDGGADFGPNIVGEATSAGKGYVRGLDFSIQKKLSGNGFYGTLTYSYSTSAFTALVGGEKPAAFDFGNQLTLVAGYQVANDWLFGLKFKLAGGRPYTPYDIEASRIAGRGVWDMSKFNDERYPIYHRLDIRMDKKFYFNKIALTTYIEFQNVYNRENIYGYFWNKAKNERGTIYQWAFMPVGGINVEF